MTTEIELYDQIFGRSDSAPVSKIVRNMNVVTCFTTLFAKWEFQEGGLLVQLFPRNGPKDEWFEGYWTEEPRKGGQYVPGRGERPHPKAEFPKNFKNLMKSAADVWLGDIQMDYVDELGSYVLLFVGLEDQGAVEEGKLLDSFLDKLDILLEA